MKKLTTNLISLSLIAIFSLIAISASAETIGSGDFGYVPKPSGLGDVELEQAILNVIQIILSFLGVVALVIVIIGGFKWMTSGGNDEKIGAAKKLMGAGIVGLLIVIASYAIATFVMSSLLNIGGAAGEAE